MPIKKKLFNAPFVLSLGSGAGKILSKIPLSEEYYKVALNSSLKDLELIENKVDVIISCGSGKGSGMDPNQGKRDFEEKIKKLFKTIEEIKSESKTNEIDLIPIIASLGHGFGTGSFVGALQEIKNKFKEALIIPFVITPFTWEGKSVVERAFKSLQYATKMNTCFIISNEEVGTIYKDIGSSYDKINILVGELISVVVKSFSATEGILQSIDKSDLYKFMSGELATLRYIKLKSAKDLKVETIRTNIEKRWLRTEFKTFKKSPPKLNIFYILDGKGPFEPKNLGEINEFIEGREYVKHEELKPLLIERSKAKDCNFVWMESGFTLACGKNIYGVY